MGARQAVAVGVIIAVVCAAVVWYLEEFQRRKIIAGVSEEWGRYVQGLPTKPKEGQ